MLVKELIEELKTYPANDTVSVVYPLEEGPCVEEVEFVARNSGPSLYVKDWDSTALDTMNILSAARINSITKKMNNDER